MAGTIMTMKETFFTASEYSRLIYECVAQDCSGSWEVWMEPPALLKPQKLWTGKQVCAADGARSRRCRAATAANGWRLAPLTCAPARHLTSPRPARVCLLPAPTRPTPRCSPLC